MNEPCCRVCHGSVSDFLHLKVDLSHCNICLQAHEAQRKAFEEIKSCSATGLVPPSGSALPSVLDQQEEEYDPPISAEAAARGCFAFFSGKCTYGGECAYSHDEANRPNTCEECKAKMCSPGKQQCYNCFSRTRRVSKVPCRYHFGIALNGTDGQCRAGNRCKFSHDVRVNAQVRGKTHQVKQCPWFSECGNWRLGEKACSGCMVILESEQEE